MIVDVLAEPPVEGPYGLPTSWTWVRLGDVATTNLGKMLSPAVKFGRMSRPYLRNQDVQWGKINTESLPLIDIAEHEAERFTVRDGDLIVCEGGEVGRCAIWRGAPVAYQKALHRVRPTSVVTAEYLAYCLRFLANAGMLDEYATGSTIKHLPQEALREVLIPLPPLLEQRRIVAALDAALARVNAARERLARVPAILKRYRAAVLAAAVEGRLTEDWRAANPTPAEDGPALLRRILTERRARWEEAERERYRKAGKTPPMNWRNRYQEPAGPDVEGLPQLPEGWAWTSLLAVSEVKGGITKGQKRRAGEVVRPVPYLRVANVQRGFLELGEIKHIEATGAEIEELKLLPGDILFTEGGDRDKLGRGWVWNGEIPECIHQNHIFRARLLSQGIEPEFVSWHGNVFGQHYFLGEGKQTVNLASINLSKLGALPIPLPSTAEQGEIIDRAERQLAQLAIAETRAGRAWVQVDQVTKTLLAKGFRGELVPQDPADEPAVVPARAVTEATGAVVTSPGRRRTARG